MTLRFDHVSCHVGSRPLLDDISFEIAPGEAAAIIGPNGAGKSTLLRVASGLLAPGAGSVTLDGAPLRAMTPERLAARRAMLAQDCPLRARFTVAELAGMGVRGLPSPARDRLVAAQLRRVGLSAFARRDIMSLSGGERQRAHFARVLAQLDAGAQEGRPGLLLLDEPISAQDLAHQGRSLDLAREHVRRGGACLMVLHDLNWAASRADRIIVLKQGRIFAQGPPEAVLTPETLGAAFGVAAPHVRIHAETGRPFVIPHDLARSNIHSEEDIHVYRHEPFQGRTGLRGGVPAPLA
ncbi:heme ABC transporter ATP-binding protein [Acidomonas methanolica]|uniref:heme ABC transporter ATP-binding protein n=2 Tax=Acidomonas methanolica TaxID=437 RepID=UPI00104B1FDC|nr:heme ABC transporter ATP-binding protein [Acidomonas methanolica]MBU2654833.1 heme ABC transporter ATP-binding protein [Acidomonas methanolica]TCS26497.1 iron complex transport system ATP-binding protein [Acidomonas methanolica]GEK99247.1 hemin import ATP-binding protein HmuV [Acidomonas methanolica NBRC 104435]